MNRCQTIRPKDDKYKFARKSYKELRHWSRTPFKLKVVEQFSKYSIVVLNFLLKLCTFLFLSLLSNILKSSPFLFRYVPHLSIWGSHKCVWIYLKDNVQLSIHDTMNLSNVHHINQIGLSFICLNSHFLGDYIDASLYIDWNVLRI